MTDTIEAASLADGVSSALREDIIAGSVPPGLRITEAWVAKRFGVARPTAKAALDRLIGAGLLRRGPRRSATVPKLEAADIRDIYFSREPIEALAVGQLADSRSLPVEAEAALRSMGAAAERGAHLAHTEADIEFHRRLVAGVGSERLSRMHDAIMGEAELCIAQVRQHDLADLDHLTRLHVAIADAIRAGDHGAAVAALKNDLDTCREALLEDAGGVRAVV